MEPAAFWRMFETANYPKLKEIPIIPGTVDASAHDAWQ